MNKTKVTKLVKEDKRSYGIKVETSKGASFIIPVTDVRDGEAERKLIEASLKASAKQSKYTYPSFSGIGLSYQVSHKK